MLKNPILVQFGDRVKLIRTKRNLSQEQLAVLTGVHRTYIGMIERGEKNITLINVHKLSSGLGIKVSDLFS